MTNPRRGRSLAQSRRSPIARRGQALAEFALIITVLFAMLIGGAGITMTLFQNWSLGRTLDSLGAQLSEEGTWDADAQAELIARAGDLGTELLPERDSLTITLVSGSGNGPCGAPTCAYSWGDTVDVSYGDLIHVAVSRPLVMGPLTGSLEAILGQQTLSASWTGIAQRNGPGAGFRDDEGGVGVLIGRITDAESGLPLEGARVSLDTGETALTNASGDYTLTNLVPGPKSVSVTLPRYLGEDVVTVVLADQTSTQNVSLQLAATITVALTNNGDDGTRVTNGEFEQPAAVDYATQTLDAEPVAWWMLDDAYANAYADEVAGDGAIGHWRLGEAAGSTSFEDAIGGRDATISGGVSPGQTGLLSGDPDAAAAFDGVDSYAVSNSALPATSQLTWEAWFQTSNVAADQMLIGFEPVTVNYLRVYNGHLLSRVAINDGSSSANWSIQDPALLENGRIYHAALTYDGTDLVLYRDGVEVARLNKPGSVISTNRPLNLGRWYSGDPRRFVGTLDEIAVYDHALSAAQIAEHNAWGLGQRTWLRDEIADHDLLVGGQIDHQVGGARVADSPNQAAAFDGLSDLAVSDPATFTSNATRSSVELWLNLDPQAAPGARLISSSDGQLDIFLSGDGTDGLSATFGGAGPVQLTDADLTGGWHHLVITANPNSNGTLRIYLDGALDNTVTATGYEQLNLVGRVFLAAADDGTHLYDGALDEVAIYDTQLSADWIADHYAAAQLGSTAAWSTSANWAIGTPAGFSVAPADSSDPAFGAVVAVLTTDTSSGDQGVRQTLAGTFADGQTYRASVWVKADPGTNGSIVFGTQADNVTTSLPATGEWEPVSVDWTPETTTSGEALIALRGPSTPGVAQIRFDRVRVYDPAVMISGATVTDDYGLTAAPVGEGLYRLVVGPGETTIHVLTADGLTAEYGPVVYGPGDDVWITLTPTAP